MKYGVSQGSCLGPLFFITFVNGLLYALGIWVKDLIMYADESVLMSQGVSILKVRLAITAVLIGQNENYVSPYMLHYLLFLSILICSFIKDVASG